MREWTSTPWLLTATHCQAGLQHQLFINISVVFQVLSVVGLLQDETDPMVSVMKVWI